MLGEHVLFISFLSLHLTCSRPFWNRNRHFNTRCWAVNKCVTTFSSNVSNL